MRDLHNNIVPKRGISPAAAVTDNTAFVSQIASVANGDSLEFLGLAGSIADADVTFTVLVEESDAANMSGAMAVADEDLLGTENGATLLFSDDDKVFKIGYIGTKPYVRVTITPAANSGNIFLAGVWLHGNPRTVPQTAQKV
jgi:hypothetical protein